MKGVAFGVTASVMLVVALYRLEGFSRGVFALDAVIAFCLLVASRGATSSIDVYLRKRRAVGKPALIYGAGRGGALLVRELLQNRDIGILPIGFIDDDARKQNLLIEGIPVLGHDHEARARLWGGIRSRSCSSRFATSKPVNSKIC